jgi:aminopeptidase N
VSFPYQQSADVLLSSIAKRVVTPEHEAKILQALTILSNEVKPTTRDSVVKSINKNKLWQASAKVTEIKNFIAKHMNDLKQKEHNLRLPKTSAPVSYDLHLKTNVHSGDLAVDGEVIIKLEILETTNILTLHSRNLNIQELKIFKADGVSEVGIISYSLYSPTDMLTIYLAEDANVGTEFIFRAIYKCNMNDKPDKTGFYRSSYVAADKTTRYVGSTHLVHTYARTIMPAYDEPLFTAVFRVRITHHESYQALSNTEGTRTVK